MRPEEKGSASPLVVRNALFTLAWLESASVSGQREGWWEGSSACRVLQPVACAAPGTDSEPNLP